MKLAVIGFTRFGCGYGKAIEKAMLEQGEECTAWGKGAAAKDWGVREIRQSLRDWTKEQFSGADAIIFVGAAGIAVRAVAPFVKSKASDPAVLCMDEQGRFVISLLSGHLGGANELAERIAALFGAEPVITTATDRRGRFSVDDFARRENLYLDSLRLAKRISAEILEGKSVGFSSDFPCEEPLPPELSLGKAKDLGISISLDEAKQPFPETLHLIPRITVLGIGCKKGASPEQIEAAVETALARNRLSPHSIGRAASIDLKREEEGLLGFCRKHGIELLTYSAEELSKIRCEEGFSESGFVKSVTGVGNVCERSALKASGQGRLLQRKLSQDGVTVAVALEEYRVRLKS